MSTFNDSIPLISSDVIARKDKNGMLLFQVYSDEMYFVSLSAYEQIISKCDGSKTVGELIDDIRTDNPSAIYSFLQELESRQIITLW